MNKKSKKKNVIEKKIYQKHLNSFISEFEILSNEELFQKCKDLLLEKGKAFKTKQSKQYIQLLSETGIFSFFIVFLIFLFCFYKILKIKLNQEQNINDDINFFLHIALFISLWPLVPTGSFFNNWLNVIYYLPIAFILHLDEKNKNFTYL